MSRREALVKATARAINPEGLDLTRYRRRGIREGRALKVRAEDAAGALAFAALDRYEDADGEAVAANDPAGVCQPGDPLASVLLRLKYGEQFSRGLFVDAAELLVERYGGLDTKGHTEAVRDAVAAAALFEWLNDACRCRGAKTASTMPCPALCDRGRVGHGGLRERLRPRKRRNRKNWIHPDLEAAMISGALHGEAWLGVTVACCATCKGAGYLLVKREERRGMRCSRCGNSGIQEWKSWKRYRLVAASPAARDLTIKQFRAWHRQYYRFIDALRATEQRMAAAIDYGLFPRNRDVDPRGNLASNSSIESGIEEEQDAEAPTECADDSVDAVGQTPRESPEEPTGNVPPKES